VIPRLVVVRVQPMMNERDELYVTFDGQAGYQLEAGDEVRIRCAERRVRCCGRRRAATSRCCGQKLKWNER
jgi:NAD kinase